MNTAKQQLVNHGVHPSVQRIAIMKYLMEHCTHPTVDTIYTDLLPILPTLSRTTVYNTLELFCEKNAAMSLTIDRRNIRYDGCVKPHAHFMCNGCGRVFDVEINEGAIKWDTFRSSGAGGQNVNKVESGVRARYMWHNPFTNEDEEILVECTETRDQPKNKERALARLRTFIYDKEHQKYLDDIASRRKTMVSTGDRSAKIRTYNYPQGRITDHRIGYTIYNLPAFMDGQIQDCIDHLIVAENAERLKESEL